MEQITPPSKKFEKHDRESPLLLLDLPESALECILGRLAPVELISLAGVCRFMRLKCRSNHLWESHMNQRWGSLMSPPAYRAWQSFIASDDNTESMSMSCLPPDASVMNLYLALETGNFWFPAQVFFWETFQLACFDGEFSYNSESDNFQARYPPCGRREATIEDGIEWDRLRAPPVDTCSPYELHMSDCSTDLHPGDHIEVQWRRNKASPYGWYYGVVGHLETCGDNEDHCQCHASETVVLEFMQHPPGSHWRHMTLTRKGNKEQGNRADGFYGGIRKLYNHEEIDVWGRLWPA